MDQTEYKNIQTLSQFTKSQFLKKFTQLLLSVSVFSLLFAHSPLLSFLRSFNFHFSAFPFQIFSHTIDKHFIFLLCNGLVVFLAKFSGLISSSSKYNRSIESFNKYEYDTPSSFTLEMKAPIFWEKEVVLDSVEPLQIVEVKEEIKNKYTIEEAVKTETEKLIVEEEVQEEEKRVLFTNQMEEESDIFVVEYEEEDNETKSVLFNEEEGNGLLSTEELNKKFDDFIRKMKEELRIEAQQQLVII